jgi:hypothetical protein
VKVKIGTQMDERIFRALKVAAAKENRPLSSLLEEAAADYVARHRGRSGKNGLQKFLEGPTFPISEDAFRQIMEADPYDQ